MSKIVIAAMIAGLALSGDAIWRSNGEDDVWVTSRDDAEIGFHCGQEFSIELTITPERLIVPSEFGVRVQANAMRATHHYSGRIAHMTRSGRSITVHSEDLQAFQGAGGDLLRAIRGAPSDHEIRFGIRQSTGEWAWAKVPARGAYAALRNSWCDQATLSRYRSQSRSIR